MIPSCILLIEDEDEREWMAQLYLQYQRLMYSTIHKIVDDPWEIEDILQTSLEKMINKLSLLKTLDRNRLVNYIISTCKNNAYNSLYCSEQYQVFSFDEFRDKSDIENVEFMEDQLIKKECASQLLKLWPKLDTRSQYLLEAKYILDKSTKEIAEDLHIKPDSVRMALVRARKKAYSLIK